LLGGFVVGFLFALVRGLAGRLNKLRAIIHQDRFKKTLGLTMIVATTAAIAFWLPGGSRSTTVWVTLLVSFSWGWLFWAFRDAGTNVKRIAVMNLPQDGRATPATEEPLPESVRWIDLYAVNDPVPNGSLFD
jgi:hypothetical protein